MWQRFGVVAIPDKLRKARQRWFGRVLFVEDKTKEEVTHLFEMDISTDSYFYFHCFERRSKVPPRFCSHMIRSAFRRLYVPVTLYSWTACLRNPSKL
ncbi:hypothetical protein Y032_0046g1380 [Ancylostoma ceylanicum]|uniref:Uncharacterized protein n=1 Tax=Ancylostoma ceylanicum TaxID=53326 RepID=A0A016UCP2_9BILA|nr:hypothetical protein Y032_0046g1380 [Ancylostoma ceylanicum]